MVDVIAHCVDETSVSVCSPYFLFVCTGDIKFREYKKQAHQGVRDGEGG